MDGGGFVLASRTGTWDPAAAYLKAQRPTQEDE